MIPNYLIQITDKFLIGASSSYPVNTSGGTTTHSHTVPSHVHPEGNHTHSLGDLLPHFYFFI